MSPVFRKINAGAAFWCLARITVGIIFAYAGFAKLSEPVENLRAVLDAYPVIPDFTVSVVAMVLPWIEFVFGVFLIVGYAPRLTAWILGTSLVSFLTVLGSSHLFFGFSPEDCGCFGQDGIHLSVPQVLIMDSFSLVVVIQIARMKHHLLSLDHWLGEKWDS